MSPLDYLRKRIKESRSYYGAHSEKRAYQAVEKLLNGNPSTESVRKAAFVLGWRNHADSCQFPNRVFCRGSCVKEKK